MTCFFLVQWVEVFLTMLYDGEEVLRRSGWTLEILPNLDKSYIFKANVIKIDAGNLRLTHTQSKCNS